MTVAEVAKKAKRSRVTVYKWYKRLGRMPTVKELHNTKRGRKIKCI
jgi:transposase